ncbi:MAG: hypothetical protein A3E83_07250 [Gammaproteobacteria bacterium RIFCSPHIGHO2_12_FULL_41_20]|nr:MAG: hypothetical protein A3E83_07250 [Gammaproteobacteria bacterium RIFCSPHIGHO2_12_FULL_41_20]
MPVWPFFTSSLVLDIRTNEIRWLKIRYGRQRIVEDFGIIPWRGSLEESHSWGELTAALQLFVQAHRLQQLATAIALPMHAVFSKRIQLSASLTEQELQEEVYAHIQRDLLGMDEQVSIDFSILDSDVYVKHILVVAAKKDYLSHYVGVINQAGLQVKVVDVDGYALVRAVSYVSALSSEMTDAIAVFDLCHSGFMLVVFQQQYIVFTQREDLAGRDVYLQIKQALQSYATTCRYAPIQQLILCGTHIQCEEIRDFIAKEFAFSVSFLSAFPRIPIAAHVDLQAWQNRLPDLLVCYGLAMRKRILW